MIKTVQEKLSTDTKDGLGKTQTALAKVVAKEDGFWLYHKNKVDLTTMFSQPEEKLWLVIRHYTGTIDEMPSM